LLTFPQVNELLQFVKLLLNYPFVYCETLTYITHVMLKLDSFSLYKLMAKCSLLFEDQLC